MTFVTTFCESFYSAAMYRTLRTTKDRSGLGYAFLLVAVTSLIVALSGAWTIRQALNEGSREKVGLILMEVAHQVPPMVVRDGVLIVNAPQPYPIYIHTGDTKNEQPIIIIDTTGKTDYHRLASPTILITATEIITRDDKKTEIHSIAQISKGLHNPAIINRAVAEDAATRLTNFLHHYMWVFYLFGIGMAWAMLALFFYVLRIILLAALAVAGVVAGKLARSPIDYPTSLRMAAISFTPVAVIDMFAYFLDRHLSIWWILLFGTLMLTATILATREEAAA